jgi:hypothetical protein
MKRPTVHYAWVVAAVTFLVLVVTSGVRATPGVLMVPFETEFGWSRTGISGAIAINIALYGLIGPFAASLMDRWGHPRLAHDRPGDGGRRGRGVLIGTHLISACHDYGISEVRAAGLLATMGIFDIIGTTASGWLTDRVSARHLLCAYNCCAASVVLPADVADEPGEPGLAGVIRTALGDYRLAFWIAGALCLMAGAAFVTVGRGTPPRRPAFAPS